MIFNIFASGKLVTSDKLCGFWGIAAETLQAVCVSLARGNPGRVREERRCLINGKRWFWVLCGGFWGVMTSEIVHCTLNIVHHKYI